MTSCFRHTVILLLATTLIGCSSSAKKPIAAAEDPKQITTAAYDIRDLVANPLDSKVNEALAAELMKTIQQTIDAGNWNNQNTSIQYLSGQLIVKTTNQNHHQVVSLLGKLREASGIQVALESHVITVSKSRLKAIGVILPPEPDGIAGTFLDADQVDHLLRAVRVVPDSSIFTIPRITGPNGQPNTWRVLQQQAYVSGYSEPNPDGKRKEQISTAQSGIELEMTPTVSADRKYVTLAMHPRVSQLLGLTPAVWEKAPGEKLKVQKPNLAVQEVNTIVSVPDRGTLALLLKGDQEQIKKSNQQMGVPLDTAALLLLRPTIILQHESEQQQFPLLEPKPK